MSTEDVSLDGEGPALPAGIVNAGKGWAGEELEIKHQREQLRKAPEANFAAVDISQFQNFEVGKGYQAQHVVRQNKGESHPLEIRDMRGDTGKRTKSTRDEEPRIAKRSRNGQIQSYLNCKGFREFRKELEGLFCSDKGAR